MKGSPLLRALIAFVLIALAGVPLWKLTRADATLAAPVQAEAATKVTLRLTFSIPPEKFEVWHLMDILWADAARTTDVTKTLTLAYPKEGVDLAVEVAWPVDVEGALRLRLTDPAGDEHDKTVWGRGEMKEIVTFP